MLVKQNTPEYGAIKLCCQLIASCFGPVVSYSSEWKKTEDGWVKRRVEKIADLSERSMFIRYSPLLGSFFDCEAFPYSRDDLIKRFDKWVEDGCPENKILTYVGRETF